MKILFYIYSFIFFAPFGLYSLRKNTKENKKIYLFYKIIYFLKSLLDILFYIGFLISDLTAALIYIVVILGINLFIYKIVFSNPVVISMKNDDTSSELKTDDELKSFDENLDSVLQNKMPIEEPVFKINNFQNTNSEFSEDVNLLNQDSNSLSQVETFTEEITSNDFDFVCLPIEEMVKKLREYESTGELFYFYYKKPTEKEPTLRCVTILNVYENSELFYILCLDLDNGNQRKSFRVDRIIGYKKSSQEKNPESTSNKNDTSINPLENEILNEKYQNLKYSEDFISETNKIIFKLKDELNIFKTPTENTDIKSILQDKGFILKSGRNCHIYDKNFDYIGTLNLTITKIEKNFPGLFYISPFGIFYYDEETNQVINSKDYDFFTYSEDIIQIIKSYNPKSFFEIKAKLKK